MPRINDEIISNLYDGVSPFCTAQTRFIDNNYPHTNIREELVDYLVIQYKPDFWLELGAFVGGSSLKVAKSVKRHSSGTGIICCDPFSGDVNMWDWEKDSRILGNDGEPYKFLGLENGIPTIYQRFLANIFFNGHNDVITPIQATSIVGIKLIKRLFEQKRISIQPTVIYLDSAHEIDETYLELVNAWNCLPSGGILFGDDWTWEAVKADVLKFSIEVLVDHDRLEKAINHIMNSELAGNIFLFEGQWVLFKK